MKKKILIVALILAVALSVVLAFTLGAGAAEAEPTLAIKGKALVMESSVNIRYIVDVQNADPADVKVLVWKASQESYVKGTEHAEVGWTGKTTPNGGLTYYNYEFDGVAAKMLADDFYAVAYVKVGDKEYYSAPSKYSVLQYSYNKRGKLDKAADTTKNLIPMIEQMLDYGASAQTYFKYKTNRLANMDFYQIKTVGGTLSDGFADGLYLEKETVAITANAPASGQKFVGWQQKSTGEIVSTDMTATVEVGTANEVYTAVYGESYSEGLDFISYDGNQTYYVSGIGSCGDTVVNIPTTYNGAPVTGIDTFAFAYNPDIVKIVIPASVSTVVEWAMSGCGSLTEISVASDSEYFKSVDGVLYTKDGKTLVQYPVGKAEADFVIPEGTVTIAPLAAIEGTFTSVTIPVSLTTVGDGAFSCCYSLTDVFYNETENMFNNIVIMDNNEHLVNATLHAKISESVGLEFKETSGSTAYALSGIGSCGDEDVVVPKTYLEKPVVSILDNAFAGSDIKSIYISENITSISDGAFFNCDSIKEINVDTTNTAYSSIDGNLYNIARTKLLRYAPGKQDTRFSLPSEVTEIGFEAFRGCKSISEISIGAKVNKIGARAFAYCPALTSITPDSANTEFSGIGGSLYNKDATTLVAYAGSGTEFTVPNGVTTIGEYAFFACTGLKAVYLSDSVETVCTAAFKGCTSLEAVALSESTVILETYAFADCTALSEITLGENLSWIDDYAFAGCTSLSEVTYKNTEAAFESVYIGGGNESLTSATWTFVLDDGVFDEVIGDTPIIGAV